MHMSLMTYEYIRYIYVRIYFWKGFIMEALSGHAL